MLDLLAARGQMAMSLGFHILFAVAGMAMPLLMVASEALFLRTRDPAYQELARRWAKGTAILFAVGAVSGTVLSFELGLLWPTFMRHAGPLIGMPFSLEAFAFFLEAISLGVYLYGWERVSPAVHLASGVVVAVSGLASGVFVVAVNSWMNTPAGFRLQDGALVDLDLWQAFFNPAFPTQASHMAVAAYTSVAFAVLGIHAWRLRLRPHSALHRAAVRLSFGLALVSAPLQVLTGDLAAKHLAREQPLKLAAAEGLFDTQRGAPLTVGGWVVPEEHRVVGALEVPWALSILATGAPAGEVTGLTAYPEDEWPPLNVVHFAFDVMVGCGTWLLVLAAWGAWVSLRARRFGELAASPRLLRACAWSAPLGLVALEAGWTVTEVGRQPWIIRGVMRTADAVTPMPGLWLTFAVFTLLYVFLGVIVLWSLRAHVFVADAEGS